MIPLRRLSATAWALALVSAMLAVILVEGLYRSGWLIGADNVYDDLWYRLAGKRHAAGHVAMVMIDDPTLAALPDEPLAFWTPHFARAVAVLRAVGVKVVGIDFLLSGSPERWLGKMQLSTPEASRTYDRGFRQQLNLGGVVLAGFRVGDATSLGDFVLPSPDYLLALPELDIAAHVGFANLHTDPDGSVRRFSVAEADTEFARQEGLPRLAFGALVAVRHTGQDPAARQWSFGARTIAAGDTLPISYTGPPGNVPKVSFSRLLAVDAERDPEVAALANKAVIIGAGYAGVNDVHSTPYSTSLAGAQELMPGPEIQANIAETLLSGRFTDTVPTGLRLVAFIGSFALLAFYGVRLPPWRAIALMAAMAAVWAMVAYRLFSHGWLFPVAHLQLGLILVLIGLTALRLTREERERTKIKAVFGRYVSGQVLSQLLASSEMPELGGKATHVTVLFSDIRNFTTLSERLSAKEVVEMLNTYFERACQALLKEGATIDKFIGDAIMAEFGAPLPQQDQALRAVRAAVALRAVAVGFRQWMAERFADRDLPLFDIGIGIHTGEAVIGNIGSSTRMEYTAIGDTVNIASRLEGKTKETGCTILASAETVKEAGDRVDCGNRHTLSVKGRAQPVEAVEIVSVRD